MPPPQSDQRITNGRQNLPTASTVIVGVASGSMVGVTVDVGPGQPSGVEVGVTLGSVVAVGVCGVSGGVLLGLLQSERSAVLPTCRCSETSNWSASILNVVVTIRPSGKLLCG